MTKRTEGDQRKNRALARSHVTKVVRRRAKSKRLENVPENDLENEPENEPELDPEQELVSKLLRRAAFPAKDHLQTHVAIQKWSQSPSQASNLVLAQIS